MSPNQRADDAVALQWRRTKIIATLGPATASMQQIERLIRNGVDLLRFNMSHSDHATHTKLFKRVRLAASTAGVHLPIIFDLCGPKIRVGRFEGGEVHLQRGKEVVVTTRKQIGDSSTIVANYRRLHREIATGHRILLDDGRLELMVNRVEGRNIYCQVVIGGVLSERKGMNLPDTTLSIPALTTKDKQDVDLALALGADLLALSFVRHANDIKQLKRYLKARGAAGLPIISKIEKPEALDDIEAILAQSYAIMVARGDLGIEMPAEQVPQIQERLVHLARLHHKPVIVATQMLESMIGHPRPTRAEVGDVATAAKLSADAVMLSGETSVGGFPLEAVKTMDRVLREVERDQWQRGAFGYHLEQDMGDGCCPTRIAVAHVVNHLTHDLKIQCIMIPTSSGMTARIIASNRPTSPSLGLSTDARICRLMALHWGVVAVQVEQEQSEDWRQLADMVAKRFKLTRTGHHILLVAGFSDDPKRNEPVMKLMQL